MKTIFIIVIVIIVIISWIRKIKEAGGNPDFQEKLNRGLLNLFGNKDDSDDLSQVKIYDENGNVINFQDDALTGEDTQGVVIYDEDGNVISSAPQPVIKKKKAPEDPVNAVVKEVKSEEPEVTAHAEMYHDFIRSNGGSAIVIQEVMGKPLALR